MNDFVTLNRAGQVRRLLPIARAALAHYGLPDAQLSLLHHAENTTFRVDTIATRAVLRLQRPGRHTPAELRSELTWLTALAADGLPVPLPVTDEVLILDDAGVPEPRLCALVGWIEGRFLRAGLRQAHLQQVGRMIAQLHAHAERFVPPAGFVRGSVVHVSDVVRDETAPLGATVQQYVGELLAEVGQQSVAGLVQQVIADAALVCEELAGRGQVGLIHGDLHHGNYLFQGQKPFAIDFDDCGEGPLLYDLVVTAGALSRHPRAKTLSDALFDGYRQVRPLDADPRHIRALERLRAVQYGTWSIEQRQHPAFRDTWQDDFLRTLAFLNERGRF